MGLPSESGQLQLLVTETGDPRRCTVEMYASAIG